MKRGEQGDYTIDYEQGEIYLNPKIAVRSGSRIVVSYDVETGDDKQVYYLAAGTSLGKRARLSFTYLGESSPVGEEQELPLLKSAEMAGWSDGGKFVGAGKGSYVRVTTDSATYYVYVGDGAGDYDVTFTEVGEDRGSYSLIYSEVWQKYIYTYTGKGAFVAMIPPAPTKGSVFHIGALVQPSEWFEIDSEFAQASGVEGDLKGDKDDLRAYEVSMKATTPVLSVGGKSVGSLSASAERHMIGSSYQGFDRKVRPDFYEKWGQEDCSGSEVSNQVTLSYSLHDNLKASAVLGRLETSRGISALRTPEARLKTSRLGLRVTSSRTQVERDSLSWMLAEDVFGLSLPLAFGDFEVGRKYRVRHPTDSLGVRMDKYYCRLETRGSTLKASAQVSHSSEQRKAASTWDDYSSEWEASGGLRLDLARRLSLRAGVVHRILDYRMSDQPDQRLSAADVHLKVRDLSFLSTLAIDYSLSRRLTAIYGWELVRLDGVGDYDSLGNYVPGGGNYGIVNKEMGNEAVNFASLGIDVDLGTRASLIPSGQVSGNLRLRLDAENRSDRFSSYAIPLGNGDDVALATADLRQEIVYRKPSGLSLRLSGHYRSEVDSRYVDRDHARNRLEVGSKVMGRGPVGLSFWLEGRVGKVEATSRVGLVRSRVLKRDWMMGIGLQRSLGGMLRANVNARLFN
ncbi:MAG TPA: hypothetical protein ENI46_02150, partial [Firmicutes bacterium]|nr:hypothetical protein [Bacillota bacterium]